MQVSSTLQANEGIISVLFKRKSHLKESLHCNRLLFYQFLQQTRVCNSHNIMHWGIVTARDACARSDGEKGLESQFKLVALLPFQHSSIK